MEEREKYIVERMGKGRDVKETKNLRGINKTSSELK